MDKKRAEAWPRGKKNADVLFAERMGSNLCQSFSGVSPRQHFSKSVNAIYHGCIG
jgi:hypothetical protein